MDRARAESWEDGGDAEAAKAFVVMNGCSRVTMHLGDFHDKYTLQRILGGFMIRMRNNAEWASKKYRYGRIYKGGKLERGMAFLWIRGHIMSWEPHSFKWEYAGKAKNVLAMAVLQGYRVE